MAANPLADGISQEDKAFIRSCIQEWLNGSLSKERANEFIGFVKRMKEWETLVMMIYFGERGPHSDPALKLSLPSFFRMLLNFRGLHDSITLDNLLRYLRRESDSENRGIRPAKMALSKWYYPQYDGEGAVLRSLCTVDCSKPDAWIAGD